MEKLLQITSGRGPAECCLAVALTLKEILREAEKFSLGAEVIDRIQADQNGTLHSALVKLKGKNAAEFCESWSGILQWVAQSPYRKFHKRKNWFIGINCIEDFRPVLLKQDEIKFQTMRASGPGGQHVNKTESAVRATHILSGISVTSSESRSQLQNKKAAVEILAKKIALWNLEKINLQVQESWQNHNELARGNPKRIYREQKFIRIK